MPVDPLSDVLRAVKLTGAVFFDVEAFAPWAGATPAGSAIKPNILPAAQHLISYHVVTDGGCWASLLDGTSAVPLAAGDVIAFPHGDAHVLSSEPGARARPDHAFYGSASRLRPLPVRVGGSGPRTARLVCGYLGCDTRPFNPLVAGLPRLLHVPAVCSGWLGQVARAALDESRQSRPGGESMLARLSEVMFVEALRRHIDTLPDERSGWLAGLRDEFVGQALALLHERVDHPWTLEQLAREVALSRSALAERFTRLVGEPPIQYLARWRMQVAAGLLADGEKVAAAARAVGYGSEAAFSRAFKKMVGTPPGNWREERPHLPPHRELSARA